MIEAGDNHPCEATLLSDWRDSAAYGAIAARGRDALAWEVLRRNRAYQRFALCFLPGANDSMRCLGVRADWGLHFR